MTLKDSWLKKAYKKLKSSIYFDKTQLPLRNRIVEYEVDCEDLDEQLEELWLSFCDLPKWKQLEKSILESIDYKAYPKCLKGIEEDIISNILPEKHEIKELQYFIDMDVRGHIFSVLWLLIIGCRLDKEGYKHSYANRIKTTANQEKSKTPTYSPYLFEPYFKQYESWRDTALLDAKKCLTKNQDVVILSLDFASYFYSLDLTEDAFSLILKQILEDCNELENKLDKKLYERVNRFILKVIQKYASLFDDKYDGRNILPIGFLPSNVLSNWFLSRFDQAITDGWNPVYYGRYVDDILIVDKIEHNSDLYLKATKQELTKEKILHFFTEKCSRWNGLGPDCGSKKYKLLESQDSGDIIEAKISNKKNDKKYKVNPHYYKIQNSRTEIILQNSKVSLFYFQSGESDALLTCFREVINKNKSEFRFLPEDDVVFQADNYSEIYTLNSDESPNKLRGIKGISIDKFRLSKYLGKYLRISGLIDDTLERKFEKEIDKVFNERVAVENYTAWEKVIEIMVINEQFDALRLFASKLISAIDNIQDEQQGIVQRSLLDFFHSALSRSFALNWHVKATGCLDKICKSIIAKFPDQEEFFSVENMENAKLAYIQTRMFDKSVTPILVDALIGESDINCFKEQKINITCFQEIVAQLNGKTIELPEYIYYPYIVNMYDLAIFYAMKQMLNACEEKKSQVNFLDCFKEQRGAYMKINYGADYLIRDDRDDRDYIVEAVQIQGDNYGIRVDNAKKDKLTFAIANTQLSQVNFEQLLRDMPNRKASRWQETSSVINAAVAVKEKSDVLVMPESYLPFEWLQTVARVCAKNQMALVSGVEHVKIGNCIFNLTAVILPYEEDNFRTAFMAFHLKKHYAPDEELKIRGYRLMPKIGTHYELYSWHDCWFPVYCCYELASIKDRAIFQSYADVIIAVEWNKDVNYYSNIMESLSRDLHCYCVQVNSSNYGDSRITQPSKTEMKDLIRTKGGKNNTVLVDAVDIAKLRNFQLKEYELQKIDDTYKSTPPQFNQNIIYKKMHGQLWRMFESENEEIN